jgi:hypothetical protein
MEDRVAAEALPIVMEGLRRALACPDGLPLVGTRAGPGLFANSAAGRKAAECGQREGYVRIVATERGGRRPRNLYAITEKGIEALRQAAAQILKQVGTSASPRRSFPRHDPVAVEAAVLAGLTEWSNTGTSEDCPLSWLYRNLGTGLPSISIGSFHDALRSLRDAGKVYLHPWTGPLYELSEPSFALLVGHEVAFYASCRNLPAETSECGQQSTAIGL